MGGRTLCFAASQPSESNGTTAGFSRRSPLGSWHLTGVSRDGLNALGSERHTECARRCVARFTYINP